MQDHQAVVVDVDDIYDEFSFGEKTPQAIRDFLQWARTNWADGAAVRRARRRRDDRSARLRRSGNADFVPTKHVPMSGVALETASDDWFVDFDDNGVPDVAIGRLSVRTAGPGRAMVDKIVGYDSPVRSPGQKDVLLVADENDGSELRAVQRQPQRAAAAGLHRASHLPRHAPASTTGRAPGAHQTASNDGQLIVNYTGHGSVYLWGGNRELLTNDDVASWMNVAQLPFVVAMNCLNGLFNGIYGEESLAEAMLRAPKGGAVAVWASSSLTPAATQALVNQELFRLIFEGTYATLGEAVAAANGW